MERSPCGQLYGTAGLAGILIGSLHGALALLDGMSAKRRPALACAKASRVSFPCPSSLVTHHLNQLGHDLELLLIRALQDNRSEGRIDGLQSDSTMRCGGSARGTLSRPAASASLRSRRYASEAIHAVTTFWNGPSFM